MIFLTYSVSANLNGTLVISTNDKSYSKAIMGLNKWLTPVEKDGEKLIIDFNCKEIDTYK